VKGSFFVTAKNGFLFFGFLANMESFLVVVVDRSHIYYGKTTIRLSLIQIVKNLGLPKIPIITLFQTNYIKNRCQD
jgi:hypothetical protein